VAAIPGAHDFASDAPQLTRAGSIAGTPAFIAPELARTGAQITPAVDVFSFGVVAHRLLKGSAPHSEAPLRARLDRREPKPHKPLSVPGLPAHVARMLDACMSFDPGARPDTATIMATLRDALETTAPELQRALAQDS
jgi:serine/threonine-protein kinase